MLKLKYLKCTYGLFGHDYRVALLSTLYQTVPGIIIQSFKLTNLTCQKNYLNKAKRRYVKVNILAFYERLQSCFAFIRYQSAKGIILREKNQQYYCNMSSFTKRAIRYVWKDPNYRKASPLNAYNVYYKIRATYHYTIFMRNIFHVHFSCKKMSELVHTILPNYVIFMYFQIQFLLFLAPTGHS